MNKGNFSHNYFIRTSGSNALKNKTEYFEEANLQSIENKNLYNNKVHENQKSTNIVVILLYFIGFSLINILFFNLGQAEHPFTPIFNRFITSFIQSIVFVVLIPILKNMILEMKHELIEILNMPKED